MTKNPFEVLLKEKNVRAMELSAALGIDGSRLYDLRRGIAKKIPMEVVESLRVLNVDVESFQLQYAKFRELLAEKAREKIKIGGDFMSNQ